MLWAAIVATASAISGLATFVQTLLTVRKLRDEIGQLTTKVSGRIGFPKPDEVEASGDRAAHLLGKLWKAGQWFGVAILVLLLSLTIIVLFSIDRLSTQIDQLSADKSKLTQDTAAAKGQNEQYQQEVARQRAELEKSLQAYAQHYRERVKAADDAMNAYLAFDTPANRAELRTGFDTQRTARLRDARIKLQALVDHVKKWRPVREAFARLADGQVDALERAIIANDDQEILRLISILNENVESDVDRLRTALTGAAK